MATDGSLLFIGGAFSTVSGQTRNNLAAVSLSNATVAAWNPNSDGIIGSLALADTAVYAIGSFNNVGGAASAALAAINKSSGAALAWAHGLTGTYSAVHVDAAGRIYVGGQFTIGAQNANLASFYADRSPDSTVFTPLDVGNSTPLDMKVSGGYLFVGGIMTSLTGDAYHVLRFNAAGDVQTFDPRIVMGGVNTIAVDGAAIFAGGAFAGAGGALRGNATIVDAVTGGLR